MTNHSAGDLFLFFIDRGAAESECAYRNLYSTGPTYVVTDGPGDEETGEANFAVMTLQDAYESMFPCWIAFGDGRKSEVIRTDLMP